MSHRNIPIFRFSDCCWLLSEGPRKPLPPLFLSLIFTQLDLAVFVFPWFSYIQLIHRKRSPCISQRVKINSLSSLNPRQSFTCDHSTGVRQKHLQQQFLPNVSSFSSIWICHFYGSLWFLFEPEIGTGIFKTADQIFFQMSSFSLICSR